MELDTMTISRSSMEPYNLLFHLSLDLYVHNKSLMWPRSADVLNDIITLDRYSVLSV